MSERIDVSELSDDELVALYYDIAEEFEARLKYRRPVELTDEEKANLPF